MQRWSSNWKSDGFDVWPSRPERFQDLFPYIHTCPQNKGQVEAQPMRTSCMKWHATTRINIVITVCSVASLNGDSPHAFKVIIPFDWIPNFWVLSSFWLYIQYFKYLQVVNLQPPPCSPLRRQESHQSPKRNRIVGAYPCPTTTQRLLGSSWNSLAPDI